MAKFRSIKNSLLGGEISPTVMGRTDLPQYAHSCKKLHNMIPLTSGGAYRRPGTQAVVNATTAGLFPTATNGAPAIYPFEFSSTDTLGIIFVNDSAYTPTGQVYAASSSSLSLVGTIEASAGLYTSYKGVSMGSFNHGWSNTELAQLQYAQSGDIQYFVSPTYKPMRLVRDLITAGKLSMVEFDYGKTGTALREAWPYLPPNESTAHYLKPSGLTGNITITSYSDAGGTTPKDFFNLGHVGTLFKIQHGTTFGCVRITGYTSSSVVSATTVVNLGNTTTTLNWAEGAWSDYRGWPKTVGFFQDRLFYGGNENNPDAIWFSKEHDYDVLSVVSIPIDSGGGPIETLPDPTRMMAGTQSFTHLLYSQQLNEIMWTSPGKALFVGTSGAEWTVDRKTAGTFGQDNINSLLQTEYGSTYLPATRAGNEVLFCSANSREINALVFSNDEQSYQAEKLQATFDEYPKTDFTFGYKNFSWDESRKTLWCCDGPGNLFGLTRDRRLGIMTWHTHSLGAHTYDTEFTEQISFRDGSVISLTTLNYGRFNDLWMVVFRELDGVTVYTVEVMRGYEPRIDSVSKLATQIQDMDSIGAITPANLAQILPPTVDCCIPKLNYTLGGSLPTDLTYSFTLKHFDTETITGTAINENGVFTLPDVTVATDIATLTTGIPTGYATKPTLVYLGFPFTSIVSPVRIEAGSQIGTAQGTVKIITEVVVRFYRTMSAKVGRDENNLETLVFREGTTPMGKSADAFTGDKRILFSGDYDRDGYIMILQDQPLPFSVIAIVAEGVTYD